MAAGKQADLTVLNLNELRFSGVGDTIVALLMCGTHRVDKLMMAGEGLIEDSHHVAEIETSLMALHAQLAKTLQSI